MIVKQITLGHNDFLVIDLMKPMSLDIEVFPGDPKPIRKILTSLKDDGWEHYIHEICDHCFQPHADAPKHHTENTKDKGIEIYDTDFVFNRAFLIDLSDDKNSITKNNITFLREITKKHLLPFEKQFKENSAVIIRTGYDKWLEQNYTNEEWLLPYLTIEASEYITSFENIKVIGIDSMTVDSPGSNKAHKLLKNKLIVESLVNLSLIPKSSRNNFDLQTSPLKIIGATGSPVTAYAFFEI